MTDPKEKTEPTTFEDSIRRLGEIVQKLEAGELSLEESLQAFEKGVALARAAQARLDAAEARVEELLAVDDQGRAQTRPLDGRPTAPDAPTSKARPNAPPRNEPPAGDDDDLPF